MATRPTCTRWLILTLGIGLLGLHADAQTGDDVAAFKSALSGARVAVSPETSRLTRSPWGPELFRATVDAVVLVYVKDRGVGSGVIVSQNCEAVTNWHVVKEIRRVVVIFRPRPPKTFETLTQEDIFAATVLKTRPSLDLALLRLDRCPAGGSYLRLEDPERIEVGQDVFAIGHPEKLFWTYTEGVISQIRPRSRWKSDGQEFVATLIQTQTPVSYGSSGGPLINRSGNLVGVISNTLVERAGFNFAISAHELKPFLGQ
jgi:S1-C subfamily serine protease